jgi:hypothetical protein
MPRAKRARTRPTGAAAVGTEAVGVGVGVGVGVDDKSVGDSADAAAPAPSPLDPQLSVVLSNLCDNDEDDDEGEVDWLLEQPGLRLSMKPTTTTTTTTTTTSTSTAIATKTVGEMEEEKEQPSLQSTDGCSSSSRPDLPRSLTRSEQDDGQRKPTSVAAAGNLIGGSGGGTAPSKALASPLGSLDVNAQRRVWGPPSIGRIVDDHTSTSVGKAADDVEPAAALTPEQMQRGTDRRF